LDPTRKHCSRFSTHRRLVLWNRTVIICSGFGSRQYLAQFSNKTFVQNLSFAMPEAALIFRKLASPVWFFTSNCILCWIRFQIQFRIRNRNAFRFRFRKGKKSRFLRFRFHNTAKANS
jgi:hypothetical protein